MSDATTTDPGRQPLVIASQSRKGGVGKTTVSCGLGSVMAHLGRKTLVVDLDKQSNVAWAIGLPFDSCLTADLLEFRNPDPLPTVQAGLFGLNGGLRLEELNLAAMDQDQLAVAVGRMAQRHGFEVVILDCPTGNSQYERMALRAAEVSLAVTDAHPFAVHGVMQLATHILQSRDNGLKVPRRVVFVQSRIDARRAADRELGPALAKHFPELPSVVVPQDVDVATTIGTGEPIMKAIPKSRAAQGLTELAKLILKGRK